jgi:hypothetical protein
MAVFHGGRGALLAAVVVSGCVLGVSAQTAPPQTAPAQAAPSQTELSREEKTQFLLTARIISSHNIPTGITSPIR